MKMSNFKMPVMAVLLALSLPVFAGGNSNNSDNITNNYNGDTNTYNQPSAIAGAAATSSATGIGVGSANVDIKNSNSNVAVGGQGGKGGDGGLGVGIGVGGQGGNSAAISKGGEANAKTGDVHSSIAIGGTDIDYPKIAPSAIAPGAYSATICPIVTPSTKAASVFFMSVSGTTGVTINGICAAYHEKDFNLVHQIACDEDSGYRRAMRKLGRTCAE